MTRSIPKRLTLWLTLLLVITACSQTPETPPDPVTPPVISVTVDPTLTPNTPELPGFEDGKPRPVATVTGEEGEQADFVADELWLSTDQEAALDAFLTRWNGTVLKVFNPAEHNLTGLRPQYLVRIDTAAADPATLADDLQTLDPNATGSYRVSSTAGLGLLAAGATEAAAGLEVGLNWVGTPSQFRDRTSNEAPSGPTLAGVAYTPNAYGWPSHNVGTDSVLNIGVAEAWRALELAGKLDNRIKLAVLDMGFQPDADWQDGWLAVSNVPFINPVGTENPFNCSGGGSCPWHGTNVASAAMGKPDNDYGSAGPAGPVADPVAVYTTGDMFLSMTALGEARVAGARIANMSYGAPVPWYLAWSVLPFEGATAAFRATGMLIFASAGNEGKNVDKEGCTLGVCWERTWYTPCENAGVICVGGTGGNSKNRAGGSNYGNKQVDIFAPFTLWLGPDPSSPTNAVRVKNGTSFSSPFAAGVAALIWAADPSMGAGEVETILMDTAHVSPDDKVRRYVNALGGVQEVFGNVPPNVTLRSPGPGDAPLNVPLRLSADVFDFEDAFPCCTVEWTSDVDGLLGNRSDIDVAFSTLGPRTLTVTAIDSQGGVGSASVTLNIVNSAPTVEIAQPLDGDEVFRDARVILRGQAEDINEPGGDLACDRLTWTSNVPSDPFPVSGCEVEVVFSSNGPRTLTLTGTDSQGRVRAIR